VIFRGFYLLICSLLLMSCTSGPGFSGAHIDTELQPQSALKAAAEVRGQYVLWGGRIIQAEPREASTTLEVLAFPLQRNQRPDTAKTSEGRFIIVYPGYLEPADYSANRLITVVGRLNDPRSGNVGEAVYHYPVVTGDDLYLWPEQQQGDSEPRVRFGVGVGIMR